MHDEDASDGRLSRPERAGVRGRRSAEAPETFDVAIIGGGLAGAMASLMLQKRGLRTVALESRPKGREQKVVVGEALTEGTSVFLRHELGLTDWLKQNCFRKFGFDFVVRPRTDKLPESMDDCHELLLSLTQLEKIPRALERLIPTYHVERTSMNEYVAELARAAGAAWHWGASVENVELGEGAESHTVHYAQGNKPKQIRCRFVLDASGRRTLLGRQLGITRPADLQTAAVWNRFDNVSVDPKFWRTFQGVDRRRHTIHATGPGFWIWWIHQGDHLTSVGVSYDREQHNPNVKTDDRGFWEMIRKFPPVAEALKDARPLEPYQYYAHLPYRSDHWISKRRYALIGDAAWFTDALYSIGIETTCRQLRVAAPIIMNEVRHRPVSAMEYDTLNAEFMNCQDAVLSLNRFKYKEAWHRPHVLFQTALYELGEIAELYNLQKKTWWKPKVLDMHYRLQWNSKMRLDRLNNFQSGSLPDGDRDLDSDKLIRKALLPGRLVYTVTWPLWQVPRLTPRFFQLIRLWAYSERMTQRYAWWPDGLKIMAKGRRGLAAQAWTEIRERLAS